MRAKRFLLTSLALACLTHLPCIADAQTFITAWGSYGSDDGQFLGALGVAVGGNGEIYVADSEAARIQVFTSAGVFLRKWSYGSGDSGPVDLAVDAMGNVYGADHYSGIFKFTSDGSFDRQWRTDNLNLALDVSGNVYAGGNGKIEVFSPTGTLLREFSVGVSPLGLTIDVSGNIYVLHYGGVRKYTNAGALLTQWGSRGTGDGQFVDPARAAVDMDGRVYVVDQGNARVQMFSGDGTFITKWGSYGHGTTPGQFDHPVGITVDAQGGIYVADKNNSRIQKFAFAPTPVQSVTWGGVKARYRVEHAAQPAAQDR